MSIWIWNWEEVAVFAGGWWLLIVGISLILIGLGWGFWWGSSRERRLQREYQDWHKKDFKSSWEQDAGA